MHCRKALCDAGHCGAGRRLRIARRSIDSTPGAMASREFVDELPHRRIGMARAVIDVILPAYNGAGVIRSALESALAQDVPLRIIVVDDGSSDDSAAIARSYGSRVTVITQANQGVSGARNTGLAAAQAPYVALLDQDDIWQPGKLARQLDLIEAHPDVGLVFTDMRLLRRDGTVVEDGFLRTTPPYADLDRQPLGNHAYLLPESLGQAVVRFNFISPSTTLLRRKAIQEIGGFDPAFRLCDDADCWMRLLRHCSWNIDRRKPCAVASVGRQRVTEVGQAHSRANPHWRKGQRPSGALPRRHRRLFPQGAPGFVSSARHPCSARAATRGWHATTSPRACATVAGYRRHSRSERQCCRRLSATACCGSNARPVSAGRRALSKLE